jgi:hypothetical protein
MLRTLILSAALWGATGAMGIETPAYELEKSEGDFEIRRYAAYLVAETKVQSEFDKAGNQGFRKLADYIFGKNKSQSKIAMTAPVGQLETSEKIAMTAPVGLQEVSGSFIITFSMPSSYTLETLPLPLDSDVVIREVKAHRAAALRYSGTWGQERYQAKRKELADWMQKNGLSAVGEPTFARYNPPWMPWFLRHNEVIWPLSEEPQEKQP